MYICSVTAFIYTLSDPLTGEVKYVGKTNSPRRRLRDYAMPSLIKRQKSKSIAWVRSLLKRGLSVRMDIIDETEGDWKWLEKYWISQFKCWGFSLLNHCEGGEGMTGYTWKGDTRRMREASRRMKRQWRNGHFRADHSLGVFGGAHRSAKPINKLDMVTGKVIETYPSLSDLCRQHNYSMSNISSCVHGRRKSAYGHKWAYKA